MYSELEINVEDINEFMYSDFENSFLFCCSKLVEKGKRK